MRMTTHNLTCPTSRCSFPRVHKFPRTMLHWQRCHKLETYPKSVPAVEATQLVTQRAREALNVQRETARRLSHCHSSIRSGCEAKILSVFGQEIARRTSTTCRCKFGNSIMKQMRDFPNDRRNCYRDFLNEDQQQTNEIQTQTKRRPNADQTKTSRSRTHPQTKTHTHRQTKKNTATHEDPHKRRCTHQHTQKDPHTHTQKDPDPHKNKKTEKTKNDKKK